MELKLVTRKELASVLAVHPLTIKNWEKKGLITAFCTINGRPRFDLSLTIKSISKGGVSI